MSKIKLMTRVILYAQNHPSNFMWLWEAGTLSFILWMFAGYALCFQEPVCPTNNEVYESIYDIQLEIVNDDNSSIPFLPIVTINLEYRSISDGSRSYIIISVADSIEGQEISLNAINKILYTDCEQNVGFILDAKYEVLEAFSLHKPEFVENSIEVIVFGKLQLKCKIFQAIDSSLIRIHTSSDISNLVNLGNCYFYPALKSVVQMNGKQGATEMKITLREYKSIEFDFKPFGDLISSLNRSDVLPSRDLFWR